MKSRLKTYFSAGIASCMVAIECPHCDADIELEEGDFGLFECPYCEEEFEWENDDDNTINIMPADNFSFSDLRHFIPILIFIGVVCGIGLVWYIIAAAYGEGMSAFSQ